MQSWFIALCTATLYVLLDGLSRLPLADLPAFQPWHLQAGFALFVLLQPGRFQLPALLFGATLAWWLGRPGNPVATSDEVVALLVALGTPLVLALISGTSRRLAAPLLATSLVGAILLSALQWLASSPQSGMDPAPMALHFLGLWISLVSVPVILDLARQGHRRAGPVRLLLAPVMLLLVVLGMDVSVGRAQLARDTERLEDLAAQSAFRLQQDMNAYIVALRAVEALFASSEQVTRDEFDVFSRSLQKSLPGLYAVAWDAYVNDDQRADFVARMRASGLPDFEIFEYTEAGERIVSPQRPYYVPVAYARYEGEPLKALGYDMASEPTRKAALEQALYQGRPVASGRIKLVTDPDPHYDVLVLMTMRGAGEREELIGYAGLAVHVSELMQTALSGLPDGIRGRLFDLSAPREASWLHGMAEDAEPPPGGLSASRAIEVAGRRWELQLWADADFGRDAFPLLRLIVLWAGLLTAALLAITSLRLTASHPHPD